MGCCSSVDDNFYQNQIQTYIKKDVLIRMGRGGKIDLQTQMKNERIEIILMGCLESNISDMEILFRDQKIQGTSYRPDLIFRRNGSVYYIEIDENKHQSYNKQDEETRLKTIRDYCLSQYGSFRIIKFNPNIYIKSNSDTAKNKYAAAIAFCNLITSIDGLTMYQTVE